MQSLEATFRKRGLPTTLAAPLKCRTGRTEPAFPRTGCPLTAVLKARAARIRIHDAWKRQGVDEAASTCDSCCACVAFLYRVLLELVADQMELVNEAPLTLTSVCSALAPAALW
jgi:hypothetical protein